MEGEDTTESLRRLEAEEMRASRSREKEVETEAFSTVERGISIGERMKEGERKPTSGASVARVLRMSATIRP
jgi:hypothetical protein